MEVVESSYQSGDYLEQAVLAELEGGADIALLKKSLRISEESSHHLSSFIKTVDKMGSLAESAKVVPEFDEALIRILRDHSPVRRVDLKSSRFSNVANGKPIEPPSDDIGNNLFELLANIQEDAEKVRKQTDEMNAEFRKVISMVENGGFAALVLSGRSKFPELVMQNAQVLSDFKAYYDAACLTTIAATMNSYPMGLDWLPTMSK